MRKTLVATAVATVLSAGAFLPSGANAMTTTAPAGFRPAIEHTNAVEETRYVCWRVRRHGSWRRACQWRPARRVVVAPYPYYRSYGYPSYWGPGLGFGLGYGWGGGHWGGSRVVVHRHVHRRHR